MMEKLSCQFSEENCIYEPNCLYHHIIRRIDILLVSIGLKETNNPENIADAISEIDS